MAKNSSVSYLEDAVLISLEPFQCQVSHPQQNWTKSHVPSILKDEDLLYKIWIKIEKLWIDILKIYYFCHAKLSSTNLAVSKRLNFKFLIASFLLLFYLIY